MEKNIIAEHKGSTLRKQRKWTRQGKNAPDIFFKGSVPQDPALASRF
jgi:hypothetical protein